MFKRFLRSEAGTASIEYGIVALLIAAAIVGSVGNLEEENTATYDRVSQQVQDVTNQP